MTEAQEIVEYKEEAFCKMLKEQGINALPLGTTSDDVETIEINPQDITKAAEILKSNKESNFDVLVSITALDTDQSYESVYHFLSSELNHQLLVKVKLDKASPQIDSISDLYKAADWHEREAYDLMGITYNNHPDLKRILLPNDWKGHPLRKDYVQNDERLAWNER